MKHVHVHHEQLTMSTLSMCTMSIYFGHKLSKIWSVNIFLKISNGHFIYLLETNSVTLTQINYEHKKQQIIGVGNLDIPGYQDSPPQDCPLGGQSVGGES